MRSLQYPIDINPFYDPATGTSDPYFQDVEIDGATETASVAGAESVLDGFSAVLPLGLTLRDVHFDVAATTAQDANITETDSNLAITGPGVTVTGPAWPALVGRFLLVAAELAAQRGQQLVAELAKPA